MRKGIDVDVKAADRARLEAVVAKRGVFRSILDIQAAINRFIEEANHDPKPFIWTANPDKIITAVKRGH
jgi:hypothetical protein